MQFGVFRTGRDPQTRRTMPRDGLEEELIRLFGKYNMSFCTSFQYQSGWDIHKTKLYELPNQGGIVWMMANANTINFNLPDGTIKCTAIVECLGFDEEKEPYLSFRKDLAQIADKYHRHLED